MERILQVLAGILLGILLGLALSQLTPAGPLGYMDTLVRVASSRHHLEAALRFMAPIAVAGAGLAVAYRSGFMTIGSEGQILLSALTSLYILAYTGLGPHYSIGLGILASITVGVLWGLIPGVLRAYIGVNEVLSSLMLNYVALSIVNYMVSGPLRAGAFTETRYISEDLVLNPIEVATLILIPVTLMDFTLKHTTLGAALEAHGISPMAARTYMITSRRAIIIASIISGAAGGLAGFLLLAGFQRGFTALNTTPGYGYMGVLVAWLGLKRPLGSLLGSILFSFFIVAGFLLQAKGVPGSFSLLIQSMAVLGATLSLARGGRGG